MAAITPRRSLRIPHMHTPKMTERKKGLFQGETAPQPESLTKHRRLPVVDSESDTDEYDLGIISTLDSSSGEETDQNTPKTPERFLWHETRSRTRKFKESHDLKNFMKSPFTLKKYQTRYSCPETKCSGSASTPVTPHFRNHPVTPSSTHSCASVHTTSSTSSKARKSLASLIADTESCSSSLKDLNFDSDSATDSKENTPCKNLRRSGRRQKITPQHQSFRGVLVEQTKNFSPIKNPVVCLTKLDMTNMVSPTQLLKTPHNTAETKASPPKLSHNRRSVVEIEESPESACDSEKSHKRLHYDGMTDIGPNSKYPRLETSTAPKARLSLFNSDRLKEILSAKSFYGKSNPELNTCVTSKISNAIEITNTHPRRPFVHSHSNRHKRKPGQINLGVRHKIRKPKYNKKKTVSVKGNTSFSDAITETIQKSVASNTTINDTSMLNSSQDLVQEKADPFGEEKQTIEALLSQWTEEEVPESELNFKPKEQVTCFNSTIIEETSQIFQPVTAIPVASETLPQDSDAIIVELGAAQNGEKNNVASLETGAIPQDVVMDITDVATNQPESTNKEFLPVDGGFIVVEENGAQVQEELPDLDEIERELKMLDEQILQMAQCNNINAEAVLASTETDIPDVSSGITTSERRGELTKPAKLFPIFNSPNPGTSTPPKGSEKSKKSILKSISNQYVIDAGQKKFGATQCNECGVIYQIGDPQDEHDHLVHHNATDVLKYNGWKEECVVERTATSHCTRVRGGAPGWRRVQAVLARVVHAQLGYSPALPRAPHLYTVSSAACSAAGLLARAAPRAAPLHRVLVCGEETDSRMSNCRAESEGTQVDTGEPDCCSVEEYPVKCGVSRIWTHSNYRRRGIASSLLNCARASFLHGEALKISDIAFSAPTAAGKAFATKYTGTNNFFVYVD